MLSTLVALVAVATPAQDPTAKQLIERMLGHYYSAKTLTGQIKLTVATDAGSASLETKLQFEQPSKLYIYQQKMVANPDPDQPSRWLVTSDGSMFSYNVPNDKYYNAPGLRLVEPVHNDRTRTTFDIRAIYAAVSKSLGDRSMPLDIAIARRADLEYRRNQWASFNVLSRKQIRDIPVTMVGGDYRDYLGAKVSGKYQMAIADDGELLQYSEEMFIAVGEGQGAKPVRVVNQWDVDLKANGPVDPALFKVVTK